jgi:ABC-type transport system substrate-binding protein
VKSKWIIAICILAIVLASAVSYASLLSIPSTQDALVLKNYSSLSDAVQGLVNGEVDLLPIDQFHTEELKPIIGNSNVKLVSVPSYDFTYIGMNLRNRPLNNSEFRLAMLYAFNRQEVLNGALGGFGELLPPGLFSSAYSNYGWTRSTADPYSFDIRKASAILDGLRFTRSIGGQFRIDPLTGQPMATMFIISRLSKPNEVAAAALFAKDMQAVGLPVVSLPMADLDFNQYLRIYAFDMFVDSSANNPAPRWLYTLFDSQNNIAPVPLGTNLVGYHNHTFDQYAQELMSAEDSVQAEYAAEKCQEILANDLPVLPVFSKNMLVGASSQMTVDPVIGSLEQTLRDTAASAIQDSRFQRPLRIGLTHNFQSLDPATSSNPADWIALHLTTEPLMTYNQNGKLTADLAQLTQNYGTSFTLSIRSNATFYTGQSITARDVLATLDWLTRNAKPSSKIYSISKEIDSVELLDKSTLRISLTRADNLAVYYLTDIFALPANRLGSNLSPGPDFLLSQALVSSGPFLLREFTQADGVYMQLNSAYFSQSPQNVERIDAYEGAEVLGTQLISGSEVQITSSALVIDGKPVANASFMACVYDQNGFSVLCVPGTYKGQGVYSSTWQIDSRFSTGTYRAESVLSWESPRGQSVLFKQDLMTVSSVLILAVPILLVILTVVALVLERKRILPILGIGKKRRARKRVRRRRRAPARRVRTRRRRTR